ncbi:MAG: type II toxin-antitoxin system Phd/YefM family antitoxin [Microcoleaceae cyanobacterium]
MIQLNPEFFNRDGKQYVTLSYEEFSKIKDILEDFEDIQDLRTAKKEEKNSPSVSLEDVKKMLS